jgi:hypothetical protein
MEQTKPAEGRVEVEVRWETEYGSRSETLRFRGKLIDRYEEIYSVHKNVAQHRTGAMPTSENSGKAKFAEFLFHKVG